MKKILAAIIFAAAALILAGCEQFSTSYQRIDAAEFRLLDFIYEPADVAPGDTLTLTAVFAGKRIDDIDGYIDWWISFDVLTDLFGRTTVVDSMRFSAANAVRVPAHFSDNTQTVAFRIPIPANIVRTSPSIPERWTAMLPQYMQDSLPPALLAMTKNDMVDIIESAIESAAEMDPVTLQLFTVPIRVMAKIKDGPGGRPHTIISNHSVRYNRRFHSAGRWETPINRNPEIDSIVVYRVRGRNLTSFNSETEKPDSAIKLYDPHNPAADPVIEIIDGFSYFIEAHSSGSLDYTTTMFGNRAAEKHYSHWQFAHDPNEIAGIHHSNYMAFSSILGGQWSLIPPKDKRITKFTFWVTVTDEVINERLRPMGSTLTELSGRFEYRTPEGTNTLKPAR
jgi:hypothetical protein